MPRRYEIRWKNHSTLGVGAIITDSESEFVRMAQERLEAPGVEWSQLFVDGALAGSNGATAPMPYIGAL